MRSMREKILKKSLNCSIVNVLFFKWSSKEFHAARPAQKKARLPYSAAYWQSVNKKVCESFATTSVTVFSGLLLTLNIFSNKHHKVTNRTINTVHQTDTLPAVAAARKFLLQRENKLFKLLSVTAMISINEQNQKNILQIYRKNHKQENR